MQLSHSFVVPAGLEETWAHFQDISGVAECFPGAKVTSAEGDDFQGTAKVKLGPVALQYSGSGSFIERDEAGRRMVFEAKGRDKRGNGTAGATVTLTFREDPGGTMAEVDTDLHVTGRPAQFGARMMQEVSDKLLGQFVQCLQQQVGSGGGAPAEGSAVQDRDGEPDAAGPAPVDGSPDADQPAAASLAGSLSPAATAPPQSAASPAAVTDPTATPTRAAGSRAAGSDDALDLGTTVLPVVARMYGKQIGAGLLALLVLWLLRRRRA